MKEIDKKKQGRSLCVNRKSKRVPCNVVEVVVVVSIWSDLTKDWNLSPYPFFSSLKLTGDETKES